MTVTIYLIAINLAAFLAFGADKRLAQARLWRISERSLLLLAIAGGVVGAIVGQQAFRHKTRKQPFRTLLWAIPVAQAAVLICWKAAELLPAWPLGN
jgi:uncharacterized membrane protein YsdA (DUF1294 family)